MKKSIWIVLALVLVLGLATAGVALAQTTTPPATPWGAGMGRGSGMMGDGSGYLHDYMITAWADALDMSVEDLQAAIDSGQTVWQILEAQGMSLEDFQTLHLEVRAAALEAAVADGVITQEQADWMLERMGSGMGAGGCTGTGQSFGGRGMRGGMHGGMHGGQFQWPGQSNQ